MKRLSAGEIERLGIAGFECRFNPELKLAAAEGENKLPSFEMVAYNGGKLGQWWGTCVVNLENIGIEPVTAILFNHDTAQPVGQGLVKNDRKQLTASGVISFGETSPAARQIIEGGKNGFPWQASIGGGQCSIDEVAAGETVTVNGQELEGPFYLLQGMPLKEISIVVNGADDRTATTIRATKNTLNKKGKIMPPKKGVYAKFIEFLRAADEEPKTAEEKETEDDQTEEEEEEEKKPEASAPAKKVRAQAPAGLSGTEIEALHLQAAADAQTKIMDLNRVCAGSEDILVKALKENWTVQKAELEVLRASRPAYINTGAGMPEVGSDEVLVAAACLSGKLPNLDKTFNDQTLSAAQKTYKGSFGLMDLLMTAAYAGGYSGRPNFKSDGPTILRAAFSSGNLSGVLSNIANKFLLSGFMAVEQSWRAIAAIRNVPDFKEITSYALTGDMKYELVGSGGKIEHGSLGEMSYSNRAKTYARMLGITRQDIINDDMGALTQVPSMLGRGAATSFNDIFWKEFMNNSSFYTATRKNYTTGTASALSIDSLSVAEQMFMDQTDPDGNPLALLPKILLVPNALHVLASQLMRSTDIRIAGADSKETYGTSNPHAGKFDVVRSAYLSNANITGHSTTGWYLLASPQELATIEACFLDGKEVPTVEHSEADFDTLGIQMRGFHDFGVTKQEYRGSVKSKGAA